jgi:uncharacterized membrane protein
MAAVYVPTNHLYLGDIVIVPQGDVRFPDLTVEQGLRIFLTGGMSLPGQLRSRRVDARLTESGDGPNAEALPGTDAGAGQERRIVG